MEVVAEADGSKVLVGWDDPTYEAIMRRQLKLYVQRQLANAMELVDDSSPERPGTTFFVLKLLLIGVDELQGIPSIMNL